MLNMVEKWAKNICFGNHDSFINIHGHSNYMVIEMATKLNVVGRTIIEQGKNWIQLDDGRKLYLDSDELVYCIYENK
jgi:hypothetical protein